MKELLNQAKINVPTVRKLSSKAVMSAMLGVDEPKNVLIRNTNLSKVKGIGCFSRMKPVTEVTIEELAKRRTCGVCGGKEGHVGNKMHKAFPLPGESSHWQYKFPLAVEGVPTAKRMEIPPPGVCTAMMKKLPVKENWQLH
nr:hypothetical protein [Tanacetum cinerariifolium]